MPPQGNRMPAFCHPWEFFTIFYCCYIFLVKEKYPEILVELNLGLCDILESSIVSYTRIIQLVVMIYSMKYALRQSTARFVQDTYVTPVALACLRACVECCQHYLHLKKLPLSLKNSHFSWEVR